MSSCVTAGRGTRSGKRRRQRWRYVEKHRPRWTEEGGNIRRCKPEAAGRLRNGDGGIRKELHKADKGKTQYAELGASEALVPS